MLRLRWLLLFAGLLQAAGCAGVYLPPAANVPALRQSGQVTISATNRTFAMENGTNAAAAVAITDWVRVAGTFSASFAERRGIYGEGLVGAEPRLNKVVQLGVLGGLGYGEVNAKHRRCRKEEQQHAEAFCFSPGNHVDQARADYLRYSLQAYAVAYAPKLIHGGGGLRVSVMDMRLHEIDERPVQRRALPVSFEPFAFARLGLPFFQAELQLRYTALTNNPRELGRKVVVADQVSFLLGVRFVFGPGIERRWPHGWKYH